MKAVILAGGFGTRISEESRIRPKPMIKIGERPILWHIMKIYGAHDITEFIICLGYKGYHIKEFFANYFLHMSDVTFDVAENNMRVHHSEAEPWEVSLINTGLHTHTGGRLLRIREFLENEESFCLTYGDGVADIDITRCIEFHDAHNKLATVTAVQPPGRFGAMVLNEDDGVSRFQEKPKGDGGWINGGFFVLSPDVLAYIDGDDTAWEREPLSGLASDGELMAFRHEGFWHPMDTMRDKRHLNEEWASDDPGWKIWED